MPPNAVLLLTAAVGIVGSNSLVLAPIAAAVAVTFDAATAADVLRASAVYGIATALSALLLAPQADRIGAARTLFLALLVLMVALLLSAAASSVTWLAASQALAGLAAGAALPACYGLAVQIAPAGQENRTLGVVLTGWTLCLVAGVSGSALLAAFVHWRWVFVALALPCAVVLAGIARYRRSDPAWQAPLVPTLAASPWQALRVPGIVPALGVCFAFMVAFYGVYAYLGTHLVTVLDRSTASAGLATLSYGAGFGTAMVADGLIDRHGRERIAPWSFALVAIAYALMALGADRFWLLIALCAFWGAANHVGLNLIVGRLNALDATRRGAILGLNSAVTYLAVFVGTLGFRPMFEAGGLVGCAALALACLVPVLVDAIRRHGPTPPVRTIRRTSSM